MSKIKKEVVLVYYAIVEYDDQSEEFIESFDGFNEMICEADIDRFLTTIADNVLRHGSKRMIEGVGHIAIKDTNIDEDSIFCGITFDAEPELIY